MKNIKVIYFKSIVMIFVIMMIFTITGTNAILAENKGTQGLDALKNIITNLENIANESTNPNIKKNAGELLKAAQEAKEKDGILTPNEFDNIIINAGKLANDMLSINIQKNAGELLKAAQEAAAKEKEGTQGLDALKNIITNLENLANDSTNPNIQKNAGELLKTAQEAKEKDGALTSNELDNIIINAGKLANDTLDTISTENKGSLGSTARNFIKNTLEFADETLKDFSSGHEGQNLKTFSVLLNTMSKFGEIANAAVADETAGEPVSNLDKELKTALENANKTLDKANNAIEKKQEEIVNNQLAENPINGIIPDKIANGVKAESVITPVGKAWSTILLILQVAAMGAIIFAGVRFLFASADAKADIKKQTVRLAIGAIIVFSTTTLILFLTNIVKEIL